MNSLTKELFGNHRLLFAGTALILGVATAMNPPWRDPDVLRVRRLEVLDEDGRALVVLKADTGAGVVVTLDESGTPLTALVATKHPDHPGKRSGVLQTFYPEARLSTMLGPDPAGQFGLQVLSPHGEPMVELGGNKNSDGTMRLSSQGGQGQLHLSSDLYGDSNPFVGLFRNEGLAAAVLVDRDGQGIYDSYWPDGSVRWTSASSRNVPEPRCPDEATHPDAARRSGKGRDTCPPPLEGSSSVDASKGAERVKVSPTSLSFIPPDRWQAVPHRPDAFELVRYEDPDLVHQMTVAYTPWQGGDLRSYVPAIQESLRGMLEGFDLVRLGDAHVAGRGGLWIQYRYFIDGLSFEARQYYIPDGDHCFLVTFSATREGFPDLTAVLRECLETVHL